MAAAAMQVMGSESVIWSFRPDLGATYSVQPGEVFTVCTRDALDAQVVPGQSAMPEIRRANPATGPIAIAGAYAGQVLAVDILAVEPVGQGLLTFRRTPRFYAQEGGVVAFHPRVRLLAAPMIGTIGVAPAAGNLSTKVPGDHGGNMDTREIAAGATLYLQVQVDGALLALGDVHTLQGDGETSGQGIETAAEVTLRVRLLSGWLSPHPYLVRDGRVMVIVSAESLDEAATRAVEDTAAALANHSELDYDEARLLLSLAGDLRIGQIVNPLKTVRMSVPLDAVPWRMRDSNGKHDGDRRPRTPVEALVHEES